VKKSSDIANFICYDCVTVDTKAAGIYFFSNDLAGGVNLPYGGLALCFGLIRRATPTEAMALEKIETKENKKWQQLDQ